MIPIGRGQRELIIGDRGTGKTAIAIDTIINQKGQGVVCVYVAIGQKASTVAGVVERPARPARSSTRSSSSRPRRTRRRCSTSRPYSGARSPSTSCTTRAPDALRLRRPHQAGRRVPPDLAHPAPPAGARGVPGRRVLPALAPARARGQAARGRGRGRTGRTILKPGGSLTALPIIETQAGDVSAYIPTERHLDHRRADLPRERPVQLGRAPGGERGHLGEPRRAARRRRRR
jgi:F-type H+-transporting ATPase subunit alpha